MINSSQDLEHIKPIINRSVVGRKIKCHYCEQPATIMLEDRRYWVSCATCGDRGLLKNYNKPPHPKRA